MQTPHQDLADGTIIDVGKWGTTTLAKWAIAISQLEVSFFVWASRSTLFSKESWAYSGLSLFPI